MREILEIDATSRAARIQAGVLGPDLENQLRPHWIHAAAFSAIVRVLHPRRMAGDPRGRSLRDALHAHRRPDGVDARRHARRRQRIATAPGIRCGTVSRPDVPGFRRERSASSPRHGCACTHGRGGTRPRRSPSTTGRPRSPRPARSPRPGYTRRTAGCSTPPRHSSTRAPRFPADCSCSRSSRPTIPLARGWQRALAIAAEHRGTVIAERDRDAQVDETAANDASTTWRSSFLRMPYQRDALARRSVIAETFETACTWAPIRRPSRRASSRLPAMPSSGSAEPASSPAGSRTSTPTAPPRTTASTAADGGTPSSSSGTTSRLRCPTRSSRTAARITHHHAVGRDHRPWYDRQRPEPFAQRAARGEGRARPCRDHEPGCARRRRRA